MSSIPVRPPSDHSLSQRSNSSGTENFGLSEFNDYIIANKNDPDRYQKGVQLLSHKDPDIRDIDILRAACLHKLGNHEGVEEVLKQRLKWESKRIDPMTIDQLITWELHVNVSNRYSENIQLISALWNQKMGIVSSSRIPTVHKAPGDRKNAVLRAGIYLKMGQFDKIQEVIAEQMEYEAKRVDGYRSFDSIITWVLYNSVASPSEGALITELWNYSYALSLRAMSKS